MNFTASLGVCFQGFKKFEELKVKLTLDLFTWSVTFYDVGFLWRMFLVAEKIFLSTNIICHTFHVFTF